MLQLMTAQNAFLQLHFECLHTFVKYLRCHVIMAVPYCHFSVRCTISHNTVAHEWDSVLVRFVTVLAVLGVSKR